MSEKMTLQIMDFSTTLEYVNSYGEGGYLMLFDMRNLR